MLTTKFLTREQLQNNDLGFEELGAYDEKNYIYQVYKVLMQDNYAYTDDVAIGDWTLAHSAKDLIKSSMLICLDIIEDVRPIEHWERYLGKAGYCQSEPRASRREWVKRITLVLAMLEHSEDETDRAHQMYIDKLREFVVNQIDYAKMYTLLCERDKDEEEVEGQKNKWDGKVFTLFMYYVLNRLGNDPVRDGVALGFSKLFAKMYGGTVNSYKTYLSKIKYQMEHGNSENDSVDKKRLFDEDNSIARMIIADIKSQMNDIAQYIEHNINEVGD